jgi:hypothetical protein
VRSPVLIQAPVAPLSTGLNRIMVPSDVNVNTFSDPGGRFGALGTTTQEPTMLLAIEGATVTLGSPPALLIAMVVPSARTSRVPFLNVLTYLFHQFGGSFRVLGHYLFHSSSASRLTPVRPGS